MAIQWQWLSLLLFIITWQDTAAQQQSFLLVSVGDAQTQILQKNVRVLPGGHFDPALPLYANRPSALIRIQNQTGQIVTLTFINGERIKLPVKAKVSSSFFSVNVQEYLDKLTARVQTVATTKPMDNDLWNYFDDFDDDPSHRLLIVDGECISLQSKISGLPLGDELYALTFCGNDSTYRKLKMSNGYVTLDRRCFGIVSSNRFPLIKWKLVLGAMQKGKKIFTPVSETLTTRILTVSELQNELNFLLSGFNGDASQQDELIREYLWLNYGKYNPTILTRIIYKKVAN